MTTIDGHSQTARSLNIHYARMIGAFDGHEEHVEDPKDLHAALERSAASGLDLYADYPTDFAAAPKVIDDRQIDCRESQSVKSLSAVESS